MEIRFLESNNDYLVFGIDEAFLVENKNLHEVGLQRFRGIIQEVTFGFIRLIPFGIKWSALTKLLDGVEVFNETRATIQEITGEVLCTGTLLGMIAGSDSHQTGDVGRSGYVTICTISEFVDLLAGGDALELILDGA